MTQPLNPTKESDPQVPERTITIPACSEHEGFHKLTLTTIWTCLVCGGPRGEPFEILSYDGSRRMTVSGWRNPCGHIETYETVRNANRSEYACE
jgi:hypothetical protein